MGIIKSAILLLAIVSSLFANRTMAVVLEPVTIEFIKQRSESRFKAGPGKSLVHYSLMSTGAIWHRARRMSDESIGRDIAYAGSARRTQYIFLSIDAPERTTFADLTAALERLKSAIERNVTGNCQVVIQVFPRDWVFVPESEIDDQDDLESAVP